MTVNRAFSPIEREIRSTVRGSAVFPHDNDYNLARAVYNSTIDKHPGAVVYCQDETDIANCIRIARDFEVPLSVRCGGHNIAGRATNDGGVIIDLRSLNRILVNDSSQRVCAGGGLSWGQLDFALDEKGLSTVGGVISSTGVGGLALGGGLGWLTHLHGAVVDNIISARMVLANGDVVSVNEHESPELFWAIRGGGGNFGVVSEFEFQAFSHTDAWGGVIAYPATKTRQVLELYRDLAPNCPDHLHVNGGLRQLPNGESVAAFSFQWFGDSSAGEVFARQMRSIGNPLIDTVETRPYPVIQTMSDATFPAGQRNYWKSSFMDDLSDEVIEILIDAMQNLPDPETAILLEPGGGALARVPPDATAFPHRNHVCNLTAVGFWRDPAKDDKVISWTRQLFKAWQPWAAQAVYLNYMSDDETGRLGSEAYSEHGLARLRQIKTQYDPGNLFTHNVNLLPAVP